MDQPASHQLFHHQPLDGDRAIRLFVLSPGDRDTAIRGEIVHTTLGACYIDIYEHYTALSYVWGDPTDTQAIFIDNQSFKVTSNLASALRDLRDTKRPLRLWADAICIDQSNTAERDTQVQLMGKIYSVAQQTVIHLDGSEDFKSVKIWNEDKGSSKYPHFSSEGAELILSRPWFTRVWIYQELLLSKEAWVLFGTHRFKWEYLYDSLLDRESELGYLVNPKDPRLQAISDMHEARQKFQVNRLNGGEQQSLWRILSSRRGCKTSDLRDIIYGHLAISNVQTLTTKNDPFSPNPYQIPVDYTKTVSEVFIDAAQHILYTLHFHTVFDAEVSIEAPRRRDLPSWVPDWSLDKSYILPDIHRELHGGKFCNLNYNFRDNRMDIRSDPPTFSFHASLFGLVSEVTSILLPTDPELDRGEEFRRFLSYKQSKQELVKLASEIGQAWRYKLKFPKLPWIEDAMSWERAVFQVWGDYFFGHHNKPPTSTQYLLAAYSLGVDFLPLKRLLIGKKLALVQESFLAIVPARTTIGDFVYFNPYYDCKSSLLVLRKLTDLELGQLNTSICTSAQKTVQSSGHLSTLPKPTDLSDLDKHIQRSLQSSRSSNGSVDDNTVRHFTMVGQGWINEEPVYEFPRLRYDIQGKLQKFESYDIGIKCIVVLH